MAIRFQPLPLAILRAKEGGAEPMTLPTDALIGTVSCGDLRREPDGRWFIGATYLGRDGEPHPPLGDEVGERLWVVTRRLARALKDICDAMDGCGDAAAVEAGRDALRRFERWTEGRSW